MKEPQLQGIIHHIATFCASRHISAWLVGGSVRDLLLGQIPHDLDIAVDSDGVALARELADELGGSFVTLDQERGTGRIVFQLVADDRADLAEEIVPKDDDPLPRPLSHKDSVGKVRPTPGSAGGSPAPGRGLAPPNPYRRGEGFGVRVLPGKKPVTFAPMPANPAEPHPQLVVDLVQLRAATLDEDSWLRDFTINAISLPLTRSEGQRIIAQPFLTEPDFFTNHQRFTAELLDPTGGLPDIASRQLRACRPTSLQDDPLRILRAVRLAATLHCQITPELDALIRQEVAGLAQVAAERVRDELLKLLATPHAAPWLYYMDDTGILTHIIPELEPARHCEQPIFHFLPVLGHSLEAVTCAEWLLAGIMENGEWRMENAGQAGENGECRMENAECQTEVGGQGSGRMENGEWGMEDAGQVSEGGGRPTTVGGAPSPVAVQHYPHLSRTLPYASELAAHFAGPRSSGCPRVALFKLATLLHDNAKPQTKQPKPGGGVTFYDHQKIGAKVALQIARRLRISRRDAHYIETVVHNHMRLGQLRAGGELTERAIHRFFRDTGSAGPDVLLHDLADHMAASGPTIKPENWANHIAWTGILLDAYWGKPPERAQPLVNGNDLMTALNIAPGKLIGKLLQELHEAQAIGEITTREEALALARRVMEHGEWRVENNEEE